MERLRKIAKRIVGANEKIVFGLMVLVLIWQVVQILRLTVIPSLPEGEGERRPRGEERYPPPNDPPPRPNVLPNIRLEDAYKSIDVAKWNIPGQTTVVEGQSPKDNEPGLPDIQFKGIEKVGATSVYAKITVDGGSVQRVRQGQLFTPGRRARLETIDVEGNKIVFTWLPSGTKYERQATT